MSASATMDLLVGKLVSLIENEMALQREAYERVDQIMDELETMKSFLKDTERRGSHSELDKTWIAKVKDMANHVEDLIDEFSYQMNKQQSRNKLNQIVHSPKDLWLKRRISTKLENVNARIREIPERNRRYVVDNSGGSSTSFDTSREKDYGESFLFLKDSDIVGNADAKQKLVGWLLNGEMRQRIVISVVGMAGSGKTTLVANIFSNETVKRHFHCYAWITVSETYTVTDLLRNMVKEFYKAAMKEIPLNLSSMGYRDLLEILVNYLQLKRYVVVLDDVWSLNLWREINVALPDGQRGSRVMLTTRKEDIACFPFGDGSSHVHHVQPLQRDEAWDLFCRKAFSGTTTKSCPPELRSVAMRLVDKCKGLPLGIVSLGSLMSTKIMLESEWRRVYNSLNWELSNNPKLEDVRSILLLSFSDLSCRLKHCFLYCCIFPEDYVIQRKRLIRLWIAEGFVEQVKGLSLEENAENYLMELISRSMLQVVETNSDGRPKSCKMHDLLRELALSISEEEMFCSVLTGQEATDENRARRLSIQASTVEQPRAYDNLSKVRTFFVFLPDMNSCSLHTIASGFKLLKVLDLKHVPIVKLPNELALCYNLKYLNLKGTRVKELPKSVGRLQNLQTLDIRRTEIRVLPDWISKLKSLRHLLMYHYSGDHNVFDFEFISGTQTPLEICSTLENLQVLDCVDVSDSKLLKGLKHLKQLTRLGLTNVTREHEQDLCAAIGKMKLLHHLFVKTSHDFEVLRMEALSSVPPLLETLVLYGKLEKVPLWFGSLHSLTALKLHYSRLEENFLVYIQGLPNLVDLRLVNACTRNVLRFRSGFQKLSYLAFCNFPRLTSIFIEEQVMPQLEKLEIIECINLKSLPHGIEYLSSLQEMNFLNAPWELIERIRGERSPDRHRVQHIAKINNFYGTQSEWCSESLS